MTSVAAILLAAGRSSRMGAFKPLLPFGTTTVIRSCLDNLRQASIDDIVVVTGHRADDVERSLSDLKLTFAQNPDPASEMSASIGYGIRALPPGIQATLIALTDQPAVASDVITRIVEEWNSGYKLVIPTFEDRGGHPVLVDLSWRDELLSLDAEGGLKAFFDAHKSEVRRLPVGSPFVVTDIDTWDDYRTLHLAVFGAEPSPKPG